MEKTKCLFIILLLLCGLHVNAQSFEVDGVYYDVIDGTNNRVQVISPFNYPYEYAGEVVIPQSVTYNRTDYSVTSIGDGAFRGVSQALTSVVIPNSVTSIGEFAFLACSNLANITLGNSVEYIGDCAFQQCSALEGIEIPASVTNVGMSTFWACDSLKEVYISDLAAWCSICFSSPDANPLYYAKKLILNGELLKDVVVPDDVESINDFVFCNYSVLTSIKLPDSVISIGNSTFSGCTGLTSINIPDGVTSIGSSAFYGCTGLASIDIPDGVTSIGSSAFSGCTGLTSIDIPDGVTSIGSSAFRRCTGLVSIDIPDGVTNIGDSAFLGCSALAGIEIPNSVTDIGASAFGGTVWFENQPDGILYIGDILYRYKGAMPENTSIEVKDGVTRICGEAFSYCTGLTHITIPNSVTDIGGFAFAFCFGLTSVEISNGVTSIGVRAFNECSALAHITIPNSVTNVGASALYGTAWLENQPDGIIYVGRVLYKYKGTMPENTSVVVKDGTVQILESAFQRCKGLVSVTVPASLTSIGISAFNGCTALKSVINYSELVFEKGSSKYGGIAYNADIVFAGLGDFLFERSDGGARLVKYLGHDTEIVLPQYFNGEAYVIDTDAFKNNTSITTLKIPGSVASIKESTFSGCTGLKSIEILDGVKNIGNMAFYGCNSVEYIYISNTIETIGDYAFNGCNNIFEIKIGSRKAITASENVFGNDAYVNACLYVPEGRKFSYERATPWKNFYIVEMDFTGIDDVYESRDKKANCKTAYDLQGNKVKNMTRGVYIVNGRKVFVK